MVYFLKTFRAFLLFFFCFILIKAMCYHYAKIKKKIHEKAARFLSHFFLLWNNCCQPAGIHILHWFYSFFSLSCSTNKKNTHKISLWPISAMPFLWRKYRTSIKISNFYLGFAFKIACNECLENHENGKRTNRID